MKLKPRQQVHLFLQGSHSQLIVGLIPSPVLFVSYHTTYSFCHYIEYTFLERARGFFTIISHGKLPKYAGAEKYDRGLWPS